LAWLNTAPTSDSKEKSKSRLENRKAALKYKLLTQEKFNEFIKTPDIDFEFQHLIDWIYEIGFAESNGFGAVVMSYSEIEAWKNATKNDATPFDVMMIRNMSNAYISMQEEAKNSDCEDPLIEFKKEYEY
jgi:hypothetical protein